MRQRLAMERLAITQAILAQAFKVRNLERDLEEARAGLERLKGRLYQVDRVLAMIPPEPARQDSRQGLSPAARPGEPEQGETLHRTPQGADQS